MTYLKSDRTPPICDWREVVGSDGRQRLEAFWRPARLTAPAIPLTAAHDRPAIDAPRAEFEVAQRPAA